MWLPFVRQTIEMVRDHRRAYTRGPGYVKHPDGSTTEKCGARPAPPGELRGMVPVLSTVPRLLMQLAGTRGAAVGR